MHIVSLGDNLFRMLEPIFYENSSENVINLSSAELAQGVITVIEKVARS